MTQLPPDLARARRSLLLRVTDADLAAFADWALRLLAAFATSTESVRLDVRREEYTTDAGGIDNRPDGSLLAFTAHGLPSPLELDVRREVDGCALERVVVTCVGPHAVARAFDEGFQRDLAHMTREEIAALEALQRVPLLPETMGFELPRRPLGWELGRIAAESARLAEAARDALAAVATDGLRRFWLGVIEVKLGDLERAAADLAIACTAAPESGAIAVTTARVLLDLGRNREVVDLLSPFPPNSPPFERAELLALAWLRTGCPAEALAALGPNGDGVSRARLVDAMGDRGAAVRELRRAFLERPTQGELFQAGAARPRSQLVSSGTTLGALVDEDWILEMWADPQVAPMLKTSFTRDVRGYLALLAVEDIPPFTRDMDATEDVTADAVDVAARTAIAPAQVPRLEKALGLLGALSYYFDSFPGLELRMALLSMMLGHREDAIRLFERVSARWPKNAAAWRGLWQVAVSPRLVADGVAYTMTLVPSRETFLVVARTGNDVDWESRVDIQIVPDRATLQLDDATHRLTLEVDGDHPRGGESIRERVFFDRRTGEVLGRESLAR